MDIVEQAREFAVDAHSRINHRRKYTKKPYSTHLQAVAKLVASVTDAPVAIAAAWLHDTVEDTAVTLSDVETHFGKEISTLVDELTDISQPGDGNRAVRKKMDLEHLAQASPMAQTVKLADLIDNCLDITKNNPRFAKVFLKEMAALLDVLSSGNYDLYKQARKSHERCAKQIGKVMKGQTDHKESTGFLYQRLGERARLAKLVMETFIAHDIAEPLRSFARDTPCRQALEIMEEFDLNVVCLRERGKNCGYVLREDLTGGGSCADQLRPFHQGQIIHIETPLAKVVHVLSMHKYAFLETLGDIGGYLSRNEVNKPEFRMWLFGIITFVELEITHIIKEQYPDDSWQSLISENRLQKAQDLQRERHRRGGHCDLLDCLQYADKGRILLKDDAIVSQMHLDSKSMAKQVLKELQSLRDNLAHSQDIGSQNWDLIARMSYNLQYDASLDGGM